MIDLVLWVEAVYQIVLPFDLEIDEREREKNTHSFERKLFSQWSSLINSVHWESLYFLSFFFGLFIDLYVCQRKKACGYAYIHPCLFIFLKNKNISNDIFTVDGYLSRKVNL